MKAVFNLLICFGLTFGGFSAQAKASSSDFIAAVVVFEGDVEIWLNSRNHWEAHGGLTDNYTEEEWEVVSVITEEARLCNLAESSYDVCGRPLSIEQIKALLVSVGVEIDPAFQAWAESEVAE